MYVSFIFQENDKGEPDTDADAAAAPIAYT